MDCQHLCPVCIYDTHTRTHPYINSFLEIYINLYVQILKATYVQTKQHPKRNLNLRRDSYTCVSAPLIVRDMLRGSEASVCLLI